MPTLVADVLGMLEALGVERTAVVGHDWGAALAWSLATAAPQVVARLAVLSVGHPAGFFTDRSEQRERSWYMLFFQFAGVAEEALRRDDWALWRILLRRRRATSTGYLADHGPAGRADRRAQLVPGQHAAARRSG